MGGSRQPGCWEPLEGASLFWLMVDWLAIDGVRGWEMLELGQVNN